MLTSNLFAADSSSRPDIYNPPIFSPTIQELSRHCHNPSSWSSTKIFNLAASEIDNKLKSSPTQNMIDILYESNQSWDQFVNTSKMSILRDEDMKTYDALLNYHFLFKTIAFHSFSSYFGSNPVKFKGNANNIIEQQCKVYNQLKLRKIAPNTCMQIEVRIPLEPNKNTTDGNKEQMNEDEEEDDNDDEDAERYNQMLQESNINILDVQQPKPSIYSNQNMKTFDLSQDKIDSIMRLEIAPLNIAPFSYKQIEMILNGDEMGMYQTNNTVPGCCIEIGQTLNMILNSVNSVNNLLNSLNFLYIVYHHCIMVYSYITDLNGQSFGSRIFEKDLITTIPALFDDNTVDIEVKNEINNYLHFKPDDVYNEYKLVLLKKGYDKEKELRLNAFDLQLKQSVNAWNYNRQRNNINLHTIRVIFEGNNIDFAYFADINHREYFVRLLKKHGFILAAVNYLWYNLGGVPLNRDININKKDETDTDLDLDGLAIDIISTNLMQSKLISYNDIEIEENKQEIEDNDIQQSSNHMIPAVMQQNVIQQQLIQVLEAQNQSKNALLECYQCINDERDEEDDDDEMQFELPPWTEYKH